MSKRELKVYLNELDKTQLIAQIEELYSKFREVKGYYDFSFNPQETKLLDEAKLKISKEYFPINGRKPKARRSVAQKLIKQFFTLGVDVSTTMELMLYNIEIAQVFAGQQMIKQEAFYKSLLNSFIQLLEYASENGLMKVYQNRVEAIIALAEEQGWLNYKALQNNYLKYKAI